MVERPNPAGTVNAAARNEPIATSNNSSMKLRGKAALCSLLFSILYIEALIDLVCGLRDSDECSALRQILDSPSTYI